MKTKKAIPHLNTLTKDTTKATTTQVALWKITPCWLERESGKREREREVAVEVIKPEPKLENLLSRFGE